MYVSSLWPVSVPAFTSARSKSPADRCVSLYLATILEHCVPLPLPGPPKTKMILVLGGRRPSRMGGGKMGAVFMFACRSRVCALELLSLATTHSHLPCAYNIQAETESGHMQASIMCPILGLTYLELNPMHTLLACYDSDCIQTDMERSG